MATNTQYDQIPNGSVTPTGSGHLNVDSYLPGTKRLPICLSNDAVNHYLQSNEQTPLIADAHVVEPIAPFTPISTPEAQAFLGMLASQAAKSSATAYPISGGAGSTEDVVADISYFGRTLADLGTDPVYQAIGVTTGENVFMGFYAAFKAWDRFQKASRVGDFGGKVDGSLDTLRGITQGIGGGFYLGYRGTMIASEIGNVNTAMNATTVLGKVTFALGVVGNFFFGLFYLFMGVWGGYHLYRSGKFLHGLNKTESAVPFLIAQAHADTHVKLQKLQGADQTRQESFKQGLKKKCLNEFADQFIAWQKKLKEEGNLQGKELSRSEMKKVVEALFDAIDQDEEAKAAYLNAYCEKMGLQPQEVAFLNLTSLEICGLKLEEQHRQTRKEARFERAVGGEALEKVKDAYRKGLAERLTSDNPAVQETAQAEAAELEKTVRSALIKNLVIFSTFVLIGILGVVVSVATIGLFALPPGWALAMLILTVALVVAMAGIDIYFWKTGLDSSAKPGEYDKVFIAVIATVLFISMVVAIGLTWGYGLALLPLILTLVMGVTGLGVCAYGYVKTDEREWKWKANHPDFERVENVLPQGDAEDVELDERVTKLFKKLSKAERQAVRAKYFEQSAQMPFKKHEYLQLDATADFGGRYVDRAIPVGPTVTGDQYIIPEAECNILERAAKKTAKAYWEKWHHAQDVLNKERAVKMHAFMELLKTQGRVALEGQLANMKDDAELYNAFKANIYYLCKRQESAKDLRTVLHAVRTADMTEDPALSSEQLQRVQGIYDHISHDAA
ncbi:MAG: hypothetical protein JSR57_07125 [Verrucomicrobia bacterium]|nr:hypothetical protein [Verrucomicrobiota bacterium]